MCVFVLCVWGKKSQVTQKARGFKSISSENQTNHPFNLKQHCKLRPSTFSPDSRADVLFVNSSWLTRQLLDECELFPNHANKKTLKYPLPEPKGHECPRLNNHHFQVSFTYSHHLSQGTWCYGFLYSTTVSCYSSWKLCDKRGTLAEELAAGWVVFVEGVRSWRLL